jgi:hypothetical protein
MRFLLKRDYEPQIRAHVRNIVSGHNDYTVEDAEDAAIEEASGYLRSRYNVEATFLEIPLHDSAGQYNEGDYVRDNNDRIYEALVDDPGADLKDDTEWNAKDPRNKKLVTIIVDLTIYLLFTNTGRQLSELRVKRYDDAIEWLSNVQKEMLQPDLPLANVDQPSTQFLLGSNKKLRTKW